MFGMQMLFGASNCEISFTYLLFDMCRIMPQIHHGHPQHQRLSCAQPSTLKHREVSTWVRTMSNNWIWNPRTPRFKFSLLLGWIDNPNNSLKQDHLIPQAFSTIKTLQQILILNLVDTVQFSRSVLSDSWWPHELQHARPPCPSQLPEFIQAHVHWVGDAIQPSHPVLSPSPLAFNLSQHQDLFK